METMAMVTMDLPPLRILTLLEVWLSMPAAPFILLILKTVGFAKSATFRPAERVRMSLVLAPRALVVPWALTVA